MSLGRHVAHLQQVGVARALQLNVIEEGEGDRLERLIGPLLEPAGQACASEACECNAQCTLLENKQSQADQGASRGGLACHTAVWPVKAPTYACGHRVAKALSEGGKIMRCRPARGTHQSMVQQLTNEGNCSSMSGGRG